MQRPSPMINAWSHWTVEFIFDSVICMLAVHSVDGFHSRYLNYKDGYKYGTYVEFTSLFLLKILTFEEAL